LREAAEGGEPRDGKSRAPAAAPSAWVPHISQREIDVLHLIAQGLPNGEIAERLFVSTETVKSHVKTLLEKLHARTRAHAVAVAFRRGLID
jgi:DNA-binding NarL/FixJ family response regulator